MKNESHVHTQKEDLRDLYHRKKCSSLVLCTVVPQFVVTEMHLPLFWSTPMTQKIFSLLYYYLNKQTATKDILSLRSFQI